MKRHCVVVLLFFLASSAGASGWHDYRLEIAPGFAVERMNSFEVCLARSDGSLLICPSDPPRFGPLVAYAVTSESIFTRHIGAKRNERNSEMWDGDPKHEFYFRVSRATQGVEGPFASEEWQRAGLPKIAGLGWIEPRNPNFWTPLLGDAYFLLLTAVFLVWPIVLIAVLVVASVVLWLNRRKSRSKGAAV